MKINLLDSTYKVLNLAFIIIATICLNYSTIFWIGSEEQYNELKSKSFLLLFFNRFILNTLVILLVLFVFLIISRILGKNFREGLSLKKNILFDLIILTIISSIMIILRNI